MADGSTLQKEENDDQFLALQKKLPNVSSFYHGDQINSSSDEEEKKDSESVSLRMSQASSLDLKCKEKEISQPIMHLMHLHQQMSNGANQKTPFYFPGRFSHLSQNNYMS